MIKDTSFIVIPGWVINKYQLKGNALMIYSIIYGFCQDRSSCFHGSLQYLQEWTCSTKQGVIKTLRDLIDKGLVRKEESFPNNKYFIVFEDELDKNNIKKDVVNNSKQSLINSKHSLPDSKQSLLNGKHSSPNNINNNIVNNIDNNIDISASFNKSADIPPYIHFNPRENIDACKHASNNIYAQAGDTPSRCHEQKEQESAIIKQIVDYLNNVCNTSFRASSANTKKYVKARLREGYSIDDFKRVIDYKYSEWGLKPIKFSNGHTSDMYLRPSTLFGSKMEEYLQAAIKSKQNCTYEVKCEKVDRSKILTDLVF